MHSIAEVGTNIPAFLAKLWKIVEDPVTNGLISWNQDGTSFVIKDENRFARELLPMYYKHNNMASFIRQLNMYGFHKIVSHEANSLKIDVPDEIQFSHPFFVQGHPYLLDNIKRKMTVRVPDQTGEKPSPQVLGKVLMDVKQMKGRQETIDSRLSAMKLENGALWRELSVLRQKHIKQQQMVNKLIQFLVTLVHQNPNLFTMKRKYPRMLQQIDVAKMGKQDPHEVDDNVSNSTNSPCGPTIHELDPAEVLLETVVEEAEAEIEPETVSPSGNTNYFMNESIEDVEDAVEELPFTLIPNKNETIIGVPEDTLVFNSNKNKQNNSTKNILYMPKEYSKKPRLFRPKYNLNIVTSKANNDVDIQKKIYETQKILMKNQQQAKQDLQQQIQMNQQQIQKNQVQIDRTELLKRNQQEIIKNQQLLLKSRQKDIKRSQQVINSEEQMLNNGKNIVQAQRNQHQILQGNQQQSKRVQQLQRNQKQILMKRQKQEPRKNQSPKNLYQQTQKSPLVQFPKSPQMKRQLQGSLEQRLTPDKPQQQVQPDTVTLNFDNTSPVETILGLVDGPCGEVDNYIELPSSAYNSPIVVKVPPPETPPEQQDSSPLVSQDLLLGSPAVMSDTVLTPQTETATSPVISVTSPSSSNMQVARLDEARVTSPNMINRSANFSAEMGSHVDSMQSDLDSLKELLQSEGISLDANAILGCLNLEDPFSYSMSDPVSSEDPNRPRESNGNELMAYSPTLMDLTDLMYNEWSLPTSPNEAQPADDSFGEINTPQFVEQSPSYPVPAKRRKK